MEQIFKKENPKREPPSLKVRTQKMSKEQVFISLGKWANDGLKNQSLLLQPVDLCRSVGFFFVVNPRMIFQSSFSLPRRALAFSMENLFVMASSSLRRSEPKATIILGLSFVVVKHSFAMANIFVVANNSFAMANQNVSTIQQLHLNLTSSITLLDFPSKPTKHKQMGD